MEIKRENKVLDYPYGRLKTTMLYSVEFKKGQGFRGIRQSVNPKTGLLNKPKKTTYAPVMLVSVKEDNHTNFISARWYDDSGKDSSNKFMFDNFDLFTKEEVSAIASDVLMRYKADIYAKSTYCNSDVKKLLPLYDNAVKTLVEIIKTGENLWDKITVDWTAVDALKEKGYNPFKLTSHAVINPSHS
jgi:hypothetical protein